MDRIEAFREIMRMIEATGKRTAGTRGPRAERRLAALIFAAVDMRAESGGTGDPPISVTEPELSRRLTQLAKDYLT